MRRFLGWIGALLTLAYFAGLAWLTGGRLEEINDLKLNEISDFLAGAFGPLAILWLVLGYFQQGIELRQNSRALKMQAEELKNSVEQQMHLVHTTREQLNIDQTNLELQRTSQMEARAEIQRQAQPIFGFTPHAGAFDSHKQSRVFTVDVINSSLSTCTNVKAKFSNGDHKPWNTNRLKSGDTCNFTLAILAADRGKPFEMVITFNDGQGKPGEQIFIVTPGHPVGLEIAPAPIEQPENT